MLMEKLTQKKEGVVRPNQRTETKSDGKSKSDEMIVV